MYVCSKAIIVKHSEDATVLILTFYHRKWLLLSKTWILWFYQTKISDAQIQTSCQIASVHPMATRLWH